MRTQHTTVKLKGKALTTISTQTLSSSSNGTAHPTEPLVSGPMIEHRRASQQVLVFLIPLTFDLFYDRCPVARPDQPRRQSINSAGGSGAGCSLTCGHAFLEYLMFLGKCSFDRPEAFPNCSATVHVSGRRCMWVMKKLRLEKMYVDEEDIDNDRDSAEANYGV